MILTRLSLPIAAITSALLVATACGQGDAAKPAADDLSTLKNKVSYAIGLEIGGSLKEQELELDIDQVIAGMKDGATGAAARLSPEQIQAAMM